MKQVKQHFSSPLSIHFNACFCSVNDESARCDAGNERAGSGHFRLNHLSKGIGPLSARTIYFTATVKDSTGEPVITEEYRLLEEENYISSIPLDFKRMNFVVGKQSARRRYLY